MPTADTSLEEARDRSLGLLRAASTRWGFVASTSFDHYAVIWVRDALVTCLGACATGDQSLHETAASTIDTVVSHMGELGQVPALVDPGRDRWDFAEGGVVDTAAWLPIAAEAFLDATGDAARIDRWWPAIDSAMSWLRHLDLTGTRLLSVPPSTDWMDAALTRSGRTLHVNALYAWAQSSFERLAGAVGREPSSRADLLRRAVDAWFWPDPAVSFDSLFDHGFAHDAIRREYERLAERPRRHYVSHIVHAAFVDRCDVLANALAVVAGIPAAARAATIVDGLAPAAEPWPSRTFLEPVPAGDPSGMLVESADRLIDERWRNLPGRYHNGAAWPMVGGFHVAAISKAIGPAAAAPVLERLVAALEVDEWSFAEWIDGSGRGRGARNQTWSAASFLYALDSIVG